MQIAELDPERELAAAGTWADEIRAFKHWDSAKPWHYINIPDAMSVVEAHDKWRRQRNVLWAIEYFTQVLADSRLDAADRVDAYRFLVHFVADIHQPLHVGRKDDRGGNRVRVETPAGDKFNLHEFWDGAAIEPYLDDPEAYAASLGNRYSAAEIADWRGGTPLTWAQESKDYRPAVYGFVAAPAGGRARLTENYVNNTIEIINLRILQAGVRLAQQLDAIYCDTAAEALEPARQGGVAGRAAR